MGPQGMERCLASGPGSYLWDYICEWRPFAAGASNARGKIKHPTQLLNYFVSLYCLTFGQLIAQESELTSESPEPVVWLKKEAEKLFLDTLKNTSSNPMVDPGFHAASNIYPAAHALSCVFIRCYALTNYWIFNTGLWASVTPSLHFMQRMHHRLLNSPSKQFRST